MSRERARVSPACRTTPHWQLRWHDRALLPWVADCAAALIAGPRRGGRRAAYSRLEERREARVHYRRSHVHCEHHFRVFCGSVGSGLSDSGLEHILERRAGRCAPAPGSSSIWECATRCAGELNAQLRHAVNPEHQISPEYQEI